MESEPVILWPGVIPGNGVAFHYEKEATTHSDALCEYLVLFLSVALRRRTFFMHFYFQEEPR